MAEAPGPRIESIQALDTTAGHIRDPEVCTCHVRIKWSSGTQTLYPRHWRSEADSLLRMDAIGWLILVVIVLVVAAVAFVVIRRRRRGGGVIATKDKG